MSASTVSIPAGNPGARRRPVIAAEKKTTTNIEMLATDVVGASPAVGGGDEKVTSAGGNARDLSHNSVRGGEAVAAAAKKAAGNSATAQRRTRKAAPKPEKPRWVTVLSIFAKNFVLLVVLVGLVQLIRRLALKSGEIGPGMVEFEGRIADVESLLKTTARMIQVQVDVVDRKIENEKKEMSKRIDDKGAVLERELRKLEAKSLGMEKSLGDLKAVEWVSKEEFKKFYDEMKKSKGGNLGEERSLDEIRGYAREVVEKEIERHAADGLGMVDYALASGGARVVKHSEVFNVGKGTNWFLLYANNGVHKHADKMLKPSFGEPGQCFALKGSSGSVDIRLRTAIIAEYLTLEHVAKSVAYDRSSAPMDCTVSGWLQGNSVSVVEYENIFLLSEFTYDLDKSNAQTFDVFDPISAGVIDTVRLEFRSNHGNPSHTCIYRFRVHGREPDDGHDPDALTDMEMGEYV